MIKIFTSIALAFALASSQALAANCSGSIATGGTAVAAIATPAGGQRINGFVVCNVDAATGSGEPLWWSITGTTVAAATGSFPLSAPTATSYAASNNCFETPSSFSMQGSLSVVAATAPHKWSCFWW
jgi:hypothetical protein